MRDIDRRSLIAGASIVGAAALIRSARAGDLNPPAGPVQPTGKRLTDIEPRTAVQSLPGGQGHMHVISQPGSYYLTADIVCPAGTSGILITTPGTVSIDMMCFAIRGGGIRCATPGPDYLEVSDGYISGFSGDGIDSGGARVLDCYDLTIDNCARGIECRSTGLIEACHITRCADGIRWEPTNPVAATFAVDECECRSCTAHGINITGEFSSGTGAICITDCDCTGNGLDGIHMFLFSAQGGTGSSIAAHIQDCRCSANGGHGQRLSTMSAGGALPIVLSVQNTDSVCTGNTMGGMRCFGFHADLMDCDCTRNGGPGLEFDTMDGSLDGCVASRNAASGIHIMGAATRCSICDCAMNGNSTDGLAVDPIVRALSITECDAQGNLGAGFHIDGQSHVLLWNTASANTANYALGAAVTAIIITPLDLATNPNPHANYSF